MKTRKKILINPPLQLYLISFFSLLAIVSMAINFFTAKYVFDQFKENGITIGLEEGHPFFLFIKDQEILFNSYFFTSSGLILVCYILGGLFVPHRIAGPIYRLTEHIKSLNKSPQKPSEVTFRKGDFFNELEETINEYIDSKH